MKKILISACLLGERVRYDGAAKRKEDQRLRRWREEGRLVLHCPEVAGGLGVPRPAAEIQGEGGEAVWEGEAKVLTREGVDLSEAYRAGAEAALRLVRQEGIEVAILKARSPSCGSKRIYDGRHQGRLKEGIGVTAALLVKEGVAVFNEEELGEVERFLRGEESGED